jgi:general secretion pathway protein K
MTPRVESRVRQQGVALITVMLVVALATLLAVSMMRNQNISLRYAEGLFTQDQAILYTQGAEGFVQDLLLRDLDNDKRNKREVDHPGETWAKPFPAFPVPGGSVQASLHDLQGRFNLNLLVQENAVNTAAQTTLKRMLANLDLPDNLDAALIDWMDSDNEPNGVDGAEDDFYTRLPVPYRTANQPLADVSELLLVKGFTPEVVAALRPHVSALPATALINVNTATPELVRAFTENMTASGAEELRRNRPSDGYETADAFLDEPAFNGLDATAKNALKPLLVVRTGYFELSARATISGRHSVLHSVLARGDSGTLGIVSRDYGRQFTVPAAATTKGPDLPAGLTTTDTR